MFTEKDLIQGCIKKNAKAQKALYERYSAKMFGVCARYIKDEKDCEDIFIEAFFKVFDNLERFKNLGSFEGWIRRIMVNECLMFLRKSKWQQADVEIENMHLHQVEVNGLERLKEHDIRKLLAELPTGYRTIFNLYVIEGYKHREIAEMLDISINTSKSQLILAKKKLAGLIEKIKV